MTKQITMLEMNQEQLKFAQKVAERLGYEQTAYTSSSAMIGLFCLPDHTAHRHGCLVQTKEFGLLWIADLDDMRLHDLADEERQVSRYY